MTATSRNIEVKFVGCIETVGVQEEIEFPIASDGTYEIYLPQAGSGKELLFFGEARGTVVIEQKTAIEHFANQEPKVKPSEKILNTCIRLFQFSLYFMVNLPWKSK